MVIEKNRRLTSLDKLNDKVFKAIFRSSEARDMVSSFLSEVTKIPKQDFLNAYFVGGELPIKWKNEKTKIADIIVRLEDRLRIVIVEMNKNHTPHMFRKNFEYYASLITETTEIGSSDYHKVILININNFNRHHVEVPIQVFRLQDQLGNIDTEVGLVIYDVVLENLIDPRYNDNIVLEKFGKFFKTDNLEELEELVKGDEEYMSVFAKINSLSKDPEFIGYYDAEEDRQDELRFARKYGLEDGQRQLIRKMFQKNMTKEEISKITDIPVKEVQRLLIEVKK